MRFFYCYKNKILEVINGKKTIILTIANAYKKLKIKSKFQKRGAYDVKW